MQKSDIFMPKCKRLQRFFVKITPLPVVYFHCKGTLIMRFRQEL